MRWFNCKKEEFISLECINSKTDKHILRLSPNRNFTPEGESKDDIRFIPIYVNNKPNIKEIKELLLSLQAEYDNSAEVNSFYLNGKRVWLDKATRVGLFNILNLEKSNGIDVTTLWFNTMSVKINVDKALTLLTAVEIYAKKCFDNTQKHYIEIKQLESIEDCLQYDITACYPDILNITLTD